MQLPKIVNQSDYPITAEAFRRECRKSLDNSGALVLPNFLQTGAIQSIRKEGEQQKHLAYFTQSNHNVYLSPPDNNYPAQHPRNREVTSSKGCITTDQIPQESALNTLYHSQQFQEFLCAVLRVDALHEYADPLSSINLHYASEGQELGWHFDNSSFAITLLIQAPEQGGKFEYVKDLRTSSGDNNFDAVAAVLDGSTQPETLELEAGTLCLFRGHNSMHRVTPTIGNTTRLLVVLAYNTEPGISLSESARMTFYGRLG
jgi:hypothetical protein